MWPSPLAAEVRAARSKPAAPDAAGEPVAAALLQAATIRLTAGRARPKPRSPFRNCRRSILPAVKAPLSSSMRESTGSYATELLLVSVRVDAPNLFPAFWFPPGCQSVDG